MTTPLMICLMGPTCVGKGSLIAAALERWPDWRAVQVGAEMRKRHPPEYFRGRAAMPETEAEVWEIFADQWGAAIAAGAPVVLVDGQPRHPTHPQRLAALCPRYRILQLDACRATLMARSVQRDASPGAKLLSHARISRDHQEIDNLTRGSGYPLPIHATIWTDGDGWQRKAIISLCDIAGGLNYGAPATLPDLGAIL